MGSPEPPGCPATTAFWWTHGLQAAPDVSPPATSPGTTTPSLGRRIRVEHWDTAIGQGSHAAGALLGEDAPYTRLPYFFTDQYDLGIEYVGNVGPGGFDEVVVRGDEEGRVFTAFWLAGGRCWPGCTSTTGTRSTRSVPWWDGGSTREAAGREVELGDVAE